jgi:AcrR family transcriptional regulator
MAEPLRRERKKAAVRQRILAEARRLIVRQGYWATRVEEIADAADVAPATFFNYFPNKWALLAALASEILERIADLLAEDTGATVPALPRLQEFFTRAATQVELAEADLHGVLLLAVRATALSDSGRERVARLHRALSALLYAGQQTGDVRRDVDATFLSELVVGAFLAALTSWLNDPRYPLAIRMNQLGGFVTEALSTAKPQPRVARGPQSRHRRNPSCTTP